LRIRCSNSFRHAAARLLFCYHYKMEVIPAINEIEFGEIKKKMETAHRFGAAWVHLDVADGKFTANQLWNNHKDLAEVRASRMQHPHVEMHLMVENPDEALDDWLDANVNRIIVHVEAARDVAAMKAKCEMFGADLVLASNPDTPAEKLLAHKESVDNFLVLAVNPGVAGQKFQESQLQKIKALRESAPGAKIEVDGGVDAEVALKVKAAGADILASASYIWNSDNPKDAYEALGKLSEGA